MLHQTNNTLILEEICLSKTIACRNVSFSYQVEEALIHDLSFEIHQHEFVSIVGPSGCGKSTVLRLLCGLEKPALGELDFNGVVGYMPQKDLLMPWRDIYHNVVLPMQIKKKKIDRSQIIAWMRDFGLERVAHKYPYELSGGMRQRVAFLRTFLTDCSIFAIDEPFSALDAITKEYMETWLLEKCRLHKKTALLVTHDLEEAWRLSDRIFVMTKNAPLDIFDIRSIRTNQEQAEEVKRQIRTKLQNAYEKMR